MRGIKGFTLIELLIVILIISIVSTVAVLTINFNQNKQIQTTAEEISRLLSLASEEAMLRPATLGLLVRDHDYEFYIATPNEKGKTQWQAITTPPLNKHLLPSGIHATVKINDAENEAPKIPQITINASGDFSPFTLLLSGKDNKPVYEVIQSTEGKIISRAIP